MGNSSDCEYAGVMCQLSSPLLDASRKLLLMGNSSDCEYAGVMCQLSSPLLDASRKLLPAPQAPAAPASWAGARRTTDQARSVH
jgi:hypothetical protein